MKKSSLLTIILLILSLSCSNDPTKISKKDMIEKDVFIDILVDMHILDAITNESEYYRKFAPEDSINIYKLIFEKHKVTQAEFDSTVSAYTRRSDLYKEIYDEVLLQLSVRLDSTETLIKEEYEESYRQNSE
ncbi:MAG: DUF4296 domain-containing protein [Bacteroidales bacterium]|nr:DUF4296 domain-containing protein [Bacteroidales bacterium]MCF8389598.1 DUF4296 domain-containing protein [Bacteroidales bacterium]